jgi:DNA-directed RNA polymerase sigma subunit (sigma70/sigma32)
MNIALVTATLTAPLAGPPNRRMKSRAAAYRRAYRVAYGALTRVRERRHGALNRKRKGDLMASLAVRSQSDVARILGISKQAVMQTENRALAKVRFALLAFYGELSH